MSQRQFTFIDAGNPSDGVHTRLQPGVRAHVTRLQHQRTREKKRRKQRNTDSLAPTSNDDEYLHNEVDLGQNDGHIFERPTWLGSNDTIAAVKDSVTIAQPVRRSPRHLKKPIVRPKTMALVRQAKHTSSGSRNVHLTILPTPTDPEDEITKFLHALGLSRGSTMAHFGTMARGKMDDMSSKYSVANIAVARHLANATSTQLSMSACSYRSVTNILSLQGRSHDHPALAGLKNFAIRALQSAIDDPSKRTSENTLVSLIVFATAEALQGSLAVYALHMQGMATLLQIAGVQNVPPRLVRMIMFFDKNNSVITGCPTYLGFLCNNGYQYHNEPMPKYS